MHQRRTETVITELTEATYGEEDRARHRHTFSQALLGLVRLAKSEQLLDMRRDMELALGSGGADLACGPEHPHEAGR